MKIFNLLLFSIVGVLFQRGYGIPFSEMGGWEKSAIISHDGSIKSGLCVVKQPSVSLRDQGRAILVKLDQQSSCRIDDVNFAIWKGETIINGRPLPNLVHGDYIMMLQREGEHIIVTFYWEEEAGKRGQLNYKLPVSDAEGMRLEIECSTSMGALPEMYSNVCGPSGPILPWGKCKRAKSCEHHQEQSNEDGMYSRKCFPTTCIASNDYTEDQRNYHRIACNLENMAPRPDARTKLQRIFASQDIESCRKSCFHEEGCQFFSFFDRACSLFNEVLKKDLLVSVNGSTCGVRECSECLKIGKPKDPSLSYRSLSDVKFYTGCESHCGGDPRCMTWSYSRKEMKCYLFNKNFDNYDDIVSNNDSLTASFDCGNPQCVFKGVEISSASVQFQGRFHDTVERRNVDSPLSCRVLCLDDSSSLFFSYNQRTKNCVCHRSQPHASDNRSWFRYSLQGTSGRLYCPLSSRYDAELPDHHKIDGRADCIYEGLLYLSNSVTLASSASECSDRAKRNGMKFFSFQSGDSVTAGTCYMLTGAPTSAVETNYNFAGAISGFVDCMSDPLFEVGFNAIGCIEPSMKISRNGNKIRTDSFMECQVQCAELSGQCRFWSFDWELQHCYLFAKTPSIISTTNDNHFVQEYDRVNSVPLISYGHNGWVSGRGNCGNPDCYLRHISLTGKMEHLNEVEESDVFECQFSCQRSERCVFWSFNKKKCNHYAKLPTTRNLVKTAGSYAGPATCSSIFTNGEIPCSMPGRYYESLNKQEYVTHMFKIFDIIPCREACQQNIDCQYFTIIYSGAKKGCYLSKMKELRRDTQFAWDNNSFTGSALCEFETGSDAASTSAMPVSATMGYEYKIEGTPYLGNFVGELNSVSYIDCVYECDSLGDACEMWTATVDDAGSLKCKFYVFSGDSIQHPKEVIPAAGGVVNRFFGLNAFEGLTNWSKNTILHTRNSSYSTKDKQIILPGVRLGGNPLSVHSSATLETCIQMGEKYFFTFDRVHSKCLLFDAKNPIVHRNTISTSSMGSQTFIWSDNSYSTGYIRCSVNPNNDQIEVTDT